MNKSTSSTQGQSSARNVRMNEPSRHKHCRTMVAHGAMVTAMLALLVLASVAGVQAQTPVTSAQPTPRTLTYQALIKNGEQPVADGAHAITVPLHADENRTTPIWTASSNPVVT